MMDVLIPRGPGAAAAFLLVSTLVLSPAAVAETSDLAQESTEQIRGPFGGGMKAAPHDGPGSVLNERVREEIKRNMARLRAEGKLPEPSGIDGAVLFEWPYAAANGLSMTAIYGVPNYFDHDPLLGVLEDWNCGDRTYDLPIGYNHNATDIASWPFRWKHMAEEKVVVVAAAPGVIIFRQDGIFDQECTGGDPDNLSPGNAVTVRHSDGSYVLYAHMKNGSVTPKLVGETVEAREVLGVVGSSGSSYLPHLHMELYNVLDFAVDPYSGPCNQASSLWVSQRPYYESMINHLSVGDAPADATPACPTIESPNEATEFVAPTTVYFTAYYHDQQLGQVTELELYQPDGTLYDSLTSPRSASSSPASPSPCWCSKASCRSTTTTASTCPRCPIMDRPSPSTTWCTTPAGSATGRERWPWPAGRWAT
jgi:murein DD-endopeptidase MepM/ murein hydrolase activator NlpD